MAIREAFALLASAVIMGGALLYLFALRRRQVIERNEANHREMTPFTAVMGMLVAISASMSVAILIMSHM